MVFQSPLSTDTRQEPRTAVALAERAPWALVAVFLLLAPLEASAQMDSGQFELSDDFHVGNRTASMGPATRAFVISNLGTSAWQFPGQALPTYLSSHFLLAEPYGAYREALPHYPGTPRAFRSSLPRTSQGSNPDRFPPSGDIEVRGKSVEVSGRTYYPPSVQFVARWSDDHSGVSKWDAKINERNVRPEDWLGPWEPGTYQVHSTAEDRAGHTSQTDKITFEIDAEAPVLSWQPLEDPAIDCDGKRVFDSPLSVSVSAADSQSGVQSIEWSIDGQDWLAVEEVLVVENPDFWLRSTDRVGNQTSIHGRVELDQANPAIEVMTESGARLPQGQMAELSVGTKLTLAALDEDCSVPGFHISFGDGPWMDAPPTLAFDRPGKVKFWLAATDPLGKQTVAMWKLKVR